MAVNVNVVKFCTQYEKDPELKSRVDEATASYPGSLELREAIVEDVIIPIAESMGMGFTVEDLRAYETKKFLEERMKDDPQNEIPPEREYWLLNRGWESNEAQFCQD